MLCLLVACEQPDRSVPEATPVDVDPLGIASAPLPKRSYCVANEGPRCVFFWLEAGTQSRSIPVRCPRDLEPGERIRRAGDTCIRERTTAERNHPVRCPGTLVSAPKYYADAGL